MSATAKQRLDDLAILNSISQEDVAAYSGDFDQVKENLKCLNIPALVNPNAKKLTAKIVVVNCSINYDYILVAEIGNHVKNGKWLVTSEWALHYIIEPAFPNTVRWTKESTNENIISVEPFTNSLWSDIVVLGTDPQWWLWGSYIMSG